MALNTSDIQLFRQGLTQALRERWVLFLIEGLVLVLLGVLAILAPMVAAITVATWIAWVILVSGIVGLITTFMARDAPGFWWSLLSAVIGVVAGVILLGGPILEVSRSRCFWSCSSTSRALPGAGMPWSTGSNSRDPGPGCW
jgi:uncharacterized membrane protein HdeD (DUF308 family)